jgi:hypothetical protein
MGCALVLGTKWVLLAPIRSIFMALFHAQARYRSGSKYRWFGRVWLAVVLFSFNALVHSAEIAPSREFQVKAVFLYNFAQFVEWPREAFDDPKSPLIIGILGLDPFGEALDEMVRGETVNGRPLVVERYRWVGEANRCHILFISGSEGPRSEQIATTLKDRSVLTVCDWEGLSGRGAIVRFVMERNRVRLRINLEAAKAAGLNISSKLLRSAETVVQHTSAP